MLVTQHAICKYVSCATCYFAHGLDSGDDHFNCLLQGESIYDFPEFTVCPSYKEDFADMLSEELSKRVARENKPARERVAFSAAVIFGTMQPG